VTSDPAKTALRVRLRGLRRRLAAEIPDAAQRAVRRLPLSRFGRFRTVGAYMPLGSEIDPWPLVEALTAYGAGQVQAALPVAADHESPLKFRLWSPGEPLAPDAFGIPSPTVRAQEVEPALIIAPVLGFDRAGARLGQGAGHYDRTLARLRAHRPVFVLGLAFAGQEVEALPTEAHDQKLDAILTETEFIEPGKDGL
jgi:5-formyltetrahydrofolate cyclo-ligase